MSREPGALGASLRLSVAAAATTWAAMLSWRGFTELPERFVLALVVVGIVVAGTGALGRWRRLPGIVTVLAQVVLGTAVTCLYVADTPYPGAAFWDALRSSVDAANGYASPVPDVGDVSVQPLLVVGGLVAMLLVDLLACTVRRVPLAGLPLLTVYSVPVSLLDGGLSWWVFGGTAAGFLLMLFLQEQEHVGRWGRSLDPSTLPSRRSQAVRGTAALVGAASVAVAVVAPIAVPTLSLSVFDFGSGGDGDGDITIENPMVDLRRDLRRGEDVDLITITTDDPAPDHLRISALDRFSNNEFSSGDRQVPSTNLADGAMPALTGVDPALLGADSTRTYTYDVSIDDSFESLWLPTQAPITSIQADGDWRYDPTTMDFLASDDDLDAAGATYSMTGVQYDFLASSLNPAENYSGLSPEVTELPAGLSPLIARYVAEATAGTYSKYDEAVALQEWFRGGDRFTYSLDDAPEGSVGTDELLDFLDPDGGRVGYCEQFAAAMTVMARTLDIPARVAVGFLTPDPVEGRPGTWVYSAHDLHAWPELYFPGAGWVLFDPTPGARVPASELPDYTTRGATPITPPTITPTEDVRPTRSPRPSASTSAPTPTQDEAADTDDDTGTSIPWGRILGGLGLVVLVVVLALAPRALRARQRLRRLAGGPEAAWEELRATMVDLGLPWPETRSPGEVEAVVARHLGRPGDSDERPQRGPDVSPEATAALARIGRQVERTRYAPSAHGRPGALQDDVLTCVAALEAGTSPHTRRRATWLPRSVGQRRTVVEQPGPQEPVSSGVVEHI